MGKNRNRGDNQEVKVSGEFIKKNSKIFFINGKKRQQKKHFKGIFVVTPVKNAPLQGDPEKCPFANGLGGGGGGHATMTDYLSVKISTQHSLFCPT